MIRMELQRFGGRGGGSGMSGGGRGASNTLSEGGGSFMSNEQNMIDYAIATGALDIGSDEETRAFLRTADGKEALKDFMDGEREAGLTESEMKDVINSYKPSNNQKSREEAYSDFSREGQIRYAQTYGYKSPLVNSMISGGTSEGYHESKPRSDGNGPYFDKNGNVTKIPTTYRNMTINGSGNLRNRSADVYVTERGPRLYVSDGNMASEYHFSNTKQGVSDALKSGKKFVTERKASTRKNGPNSAEFLVGSGKSRYSR